MKIAERRMFHSSVVESDGFLDLPVSSQALYFHLGMHADDDGFINGPKQVARSVGCSLTDLQTLVESKFLLQFDDVVVIRHWLVANNLRNDRKKVLQYPEVSKKIFVDIDKTYSQKRQKGTKSLWTIRENLLKSRLSGVPECLKIDGQLTRNGQTTDRQLTDKCLPNGTKRNGKERNLTECNGTERSGMEAGIPDGEAPEDLAAAHSDRELKYMKGNLGKGVVLLSEDQIASLLDTLGLDAFDHYVEKLAGYILKHNAQVKNHYATIMKWWQEDRGVF